MGRLVSLEKGRARKIGPNHQVFFVPAGVVVLVFVGMPFSQALEAFPSVCLVLACQVESVAEIWSLHWPAMGTLANSFVRTHLAGSFFVRAAPTEVATFCASLAHLGNCPALIRFGTSLAGSSKILGIGPALVAKPPLGVRLAVLGIAKSPLRLPLGVRLAVLGFAKSPLGVRLAVLGFAKSLAGSPTVLGIGPALVARTPLGVRVALLGVAKSPPRCWTPKWNSNTPEWQAHTRLDIRRYPILCVPHRGI